MWYLKVDTLLLMLAAAVLFAAGSVIYAHYRPGKTLTPWLILLDLGLLIYVDWKLAVFYIAYTFFSYGLVLAIGRLRTGRRVWFVLFCLLDVAPFFYARMSGLVSWLPSLIVLVGFAYNMLKAMDAVFYVYYTDEKIPFLTYANFLLFFPVLTAGPIFRYRDFLKAYRKPQLLTVNTAEQCVKRLILGLFKKLVLAALLTKALQRVLQMYAHFYVSGALALLSYAILYVDLSGYSDIAIAVGSFMGIPVPENFKKPWTAASFTQFWRKWHVTLSDFIREHIFVVVNGKRLNCWISAGIGLLTMLVMSLWHEFSLMALCTGLYMGGLLALENVLGLTTVDKRRTPKALYVFRCLIVLGLFSINAMFFTMSGSQILWAIGGFFKL